MRKHRALRALTTLLVFGSLLVRGPVASATFPGENARIAYVATEGAHRAIFTVDPDGTDPLPLVDLGDRDAVNPAWSHDVLRIAFAAQIEPGGPFAIFVASADGTGVPEQVTTPIASDTDPAWSPTGDEIAFVRRLSGGVTQVLVLDLAGGTTRPLPSDGLALEPSWSPDGTRIAYVTRANVPPGSCTGCRFRIGIALADGSGWAGGATSSFGDLHHPDWSPDGGTIVAGFGFDEDPLGPSGVLVFDAATGTPGSFLGPCGIFNEPSYSPDGVFVVTTSRSIDPQGNLSEPALCVIAADNTSVTLLSTTGSDAAWGAVSGGPPPVPDTTRPIVTFSPDPDVEGWFATPHEIDVTATDDVAVIELGCVYVGEFIGPNQLEPVTGGIHGTVLPLMEGANDLVCSAQDPSNNVTVAARIILIDREPPSVSSSTLSLNPKPIDQTATLTVAAFDLTSGIEGGELLVGGLAPIAMTHGVRPGLLVGEIGTNLEPGVYAVSASVRDVAGNESTTPEQTLVVFNPAAGLIRGNGSIVPGGASSDPGDVIPGLDGTSRALFAFSAEYEPGSSTPTGFFSLKLGRAFKLESEALSWLIVTDGGSASVQGTGTIRGTPGTFTFRVSVRDAANSSQADHLKLEVWPSGADPDSSAPAYQASGDVAGRIRILS